MSDLDIVRLRYYATVRNVGDRITPLLVEGVSGYSPHLTASGARSHLLSLGSILTYANANSFVWGTGCFGPGYEIGKVDGKRIFAVRGKKTAHFLKSTGVLGRDVAVGDPGVLVGTLPTFAPLTAAPKTQRVGIVPHFSDMHHPLIQGLKERDGVAILNVHDDPGEFLAAMARCEYVLSSSLHGLIFADALGIPNRWITLYDRLAGKRFKFEDYYSLFSDEEVWPVQLADPAAILGQCTVHDSRPAAEALRQSFPKKELVEHGAVFERPRNFKDVGSCRSAPTILFTSQPAGSADWIRHLDLDPAGAPDTHPALHLATSLQKQAAAFFNGWAEPQPYCFSTELANNGADENPQAALRPLVHALHSSEQFDYLVVDPQTLSRSNGENIALREFSERDGIRREKIAIVAKYSERRPSLSRMAVLS